MKITDFPFEILLNIFEDLDLNALANVAKTHPYNKRVAKYVFDHQLSKEVFNVNGYKTIDGHWTENSKNPFDFNSMLNALEIFGQSIASITIDYGCFDDEQSERVNEYLTKYVVDSLFAIELMNFHDKKLAGLRGPFSKVDFVHLRFGIIDLNDIKLNQIFPGVRSFDLNQMRESYSSCFEHHFPNLIEMETEFVRRNNADLTKLRRRLQLNPQLRYLIVNGANWEFLQMISEHALRLEYLGFDTFDGTSLDQANDNVISYIYRFFEMKQHKFNVHFEHLKGFGISSAEFSHSLQRIPISFGKLERFQCFESTEKWFDIFIQNKHLTKITVGELNDEQLQRITEELTNLQEFYMRYDFQINDVDKVVQFIGANKELKKVDFSNENVDACDLVLRRLEGCWRCVKDGFFYVFVRDEGNNYS